MVPVIAVSLLSLAVCATAEDSTKPLEVTLSDGKLLPLVGLGVGNLPHNLIKRVVTNAVSEHNVRLIDTAAASRNEHLIAEALKDKRSSAEVKVLTKVWYTHLGFDRTLLSVRDSAEKLGRKSLDIVLLHWPRCRTDISWMKCDEEEQNLPQTVKDAGPAPGVKAWRDSWRALEKLYKEGAVQSIGVSNFDLSEMQELIEMAEIPPQIIQGNIWSVIFDPDLMQLLKKHNIHFQAYNLNGAILQHIKSARGSQKRLKHVANLLPGKVSLAQVVLKWVVQQNISVVPRSSSEAHLRENCDVATFDWRLEGEQMEDVRIAVEGFTRVGGGLEPLSGDEGASASQNPAPAKTVSVYFKNNLRDKMNLYWVNSETGEQTQIAQVGAGEQTMINSHKGHTFVVRQALAAGTIPERRIPGSPPPTDSYFRKEYEGTFEVTQEPGEEQNFDIGRNEL